MRPLLLLALLATAASPAVAQTGPAAERPVDAVRATVARLFDGMRARDTAAVRAVFHPEARLMRSLQQNGAYRLAETPIGAFVAALGQSEITWDERVGEVEVRVDDGLATAWMPYRFYAGDLLSHCGVNAVQLARDGDEWRIVQITDTSRRDCE